MKKLIAMLMVLCMAIVIFPTQIFALEKATVVTEGLYFIQEAYTGKYLTIPMDERDTDGAEVVLKDLYDSKADRRYQLFYLKKTENEGWRIDAYISGKSLEMDNSYGAKLVQEAHSQSYLQRWNIVANRNVKYFYYFEVENFSLQNYGTDYYTSRYSNADETTIRASSKSNGYDRYNLYKVSEDDSCYLKWIREITQDDITWERKDGIRNIVNNTGWYAKYSNMYPKVGEKYLMTVEYLSEETVQRILDIREKLPSYWEEVKKGIDGKLSEKEIGELLTKLGFEEKYYVDNGLGILETLWANRNYRNWTNFQKAVEVDKWTGKPKKGVVVYSYLSVAQRGDGVGNNWKLLIETTRSYEYKKYDKTEFDKTVEELRTLNGNWQFSFK